MEPLFYNIWKKTNQVKFMKRKNLILLENRLRKLLKEDTIKDKDNSVDVEVSPGVKLPQSGPIGNFDWTVKTDSGGKFYFNGKIRLNTNRTNLNDSENSDYDQGVIQYTNKNNVKMIFYGVKDQNDPTKPDKNKFMGNTSYEVLDKFTTQEQWNNYVKRFEDRKAGKSSVGVSGVDKNKTIEIQQYIMNNFPDYKQYMGKKPDDGYWGVKTDEAILRIIFDLENKKGTQADISQTKVGSEIGKANLNLLD